MATTKFSASVKRFVKKLGPRTDFLVKDLAGLGLDRVNHLSPVRSGQLKINWRADKNQPTGEILPPPKERPKRGSGASTAQVAKARANLSSLSFFKGDDAVISNPAKHARFIENGTGSRRPSPMLRPTVKWLRTQVPDALKRARKATP